MNGFCSKNCRYNKGCGCFITGSHIPCDALCYIGMMEVENFYKENPDVVCFENNNISNIFHNIPVNNRGNQR